MPAPLTIADVQRLLAAHDLAPRRTAGQSFVVDPNTVRRIVAASGVGPGDTVLEIGPGLGSLTRALADVAARVVAVEVDAGLVRALGDTVGDLTNVEVVHADALTVDLASLVTTSTPVTTVPLVANLPYNVATSLVMTVLTRHLAVDPLFVMVQREVGERWCAQVGDRLYAGVSVKIALLATAEVAMTIPPTVFHPVPNVASVVVRLARRDDAPTGPDRDGLLALVDTAFAQRRKTLRNNLRAIAPLAVVDAALARTGIDPSVRAETLTAADVRRLGDALDAVPPTMP